ncbi:MAG: hypothetical protein KBC69_03940, partial [Candidatus Magasanikbacteria bacterium]|nr:hypothetical protein [Candidatus Magasanikbacteria bacterium]
MRKSLVAISALVASLGLVAYSVFYLPSANADSNLIEDPGFETSLSNFEPNQGGTSVNVTTVNPISGSRSLVVGISGYGDSVLWGRDLSGFASKRSSQFTGSARIKATVASASQIQFCALVDYSNGQVVQNCSSVSGSVGDKGTVSVSFALDNTRDLDQVRVGFFQEGSAALSGVLVDDVSVVLAGISNSSPTPTPTPVNGVCGSANN